MPPAGGWLDRGPPYGSVAGAYRGANRDTSPSPFGLSPPLD